ncbi:lysophospholipase [Ferruginivarius sediminum]|uniref:Lysophospholipase n=2 Tax=Ferruginivarius sediminum TaxID=2661937 RepID=A0A369T4X8_9PROT|nr:lysophospholipase [Ferruginivarius sediminum]
MHRPWFLCALLVLALAACTPRLVPPGPDAPAGTTPAVQENQLRMADGTRLPLRIWPAREGEPKAIVLGVHGFNDYSMAFDLPGQWFAAQGYTLYAYDQRGFGATRYAGLWPGTDALTEDLGTAIVLLRERHPDKPFFVVGTSMGGAVVLAAAERGVLPRVDGAVLAAPAVWGRRTMPFYQRWALWLTVHTVPWMRMTAEGLDILATDNLIELYAMGMDPLVITATRIDAMYGLTDLMSEALEAGDVLPAPTLLLYGAKDEIVPAEPMLELWERVDERPGITPALYDDGWHMILRDRQAYTVWRDIAHWMREGNPLPSGADRRARQAIAVGTTDTMKDLAAE